MSVRGIPEQDKLENQDPDVLFNTNELTGEVTPIGKSGEEKPAEEKPTPKKMPAKKEATRDDAAKGAGE